LTKISAENFFHIFVPNDIDLYTSNLLLSIVTFPLNSKFLRLSCFETIGVAGWMAGETDGLGATLNAAISLEL